MSLWTEEEVETVRRLAAEGLSARDIAERLPGRSRNAVIGVMTRNGIALARGGMSGPARAKESAARDAKAKADAMRALEAARRRQARAEALKRRTALAEAAKAMLPAVVALRFDEAVEQGRCLWFADDPFAPAGPSMPVCGAERSAFGGVRGRYCARHLLLRAAEREAA